MHKQTKEISFNG